MQKNTVATSTEAGRAVVMHGDDPRLTENASAKLARKRAEAQAAAEALNDPARYQPVDTKTPMVGRAPVETLPDPPAAPAPTPESARPARSVALATTITYRDYAITITATGLNLDQFCDMLDKRLGVVNE